MNIFLDDERNPEDVFWTLTPMKEISWTVVRSFKHFVSEVERQHPNFISFDHDLGTEFSGFDCAKWLVEYCLDNNLSCPPFQVHSKNPIGSKNIQTLLDNFNKRRFSCN